MNNLKNAFKDGAFIPFIVAGDPNYGKSLEIAKSLIDAGADILEIGIPYTDPVADGPTIQKAYTRALKNDFEVNQIYKFVKEINQYKNIPIVLLTYYNIVYNQGISNYYQKIKKSGVDGQIIADMPIEESEKATKAAKENNINQIFLISPTTPNKRIKKINKKAQGFLYVITRLGVTGKRKNFQKTTETLLNRTKSETELPLAVGFGISKPKHVRKARKAGADGVIVGSAIVEKIGENPNYIEEIKSYIQEMKKPL